MNAQQLITEACEQIGDDSVTIRSYSGRGMYGKTCTAIVGTMTDCQRVIAEVLKQAAQDVFDSAIDAGDDGDREANAAYDKNDQLSALIEKLVNFSWDSMGLDVVVYWPRMEWVEPEQPALPTDEQLAALSSIKLGVLLRDDWADYVTEEDDLRVVSLLATAKIVRDRVQEDHA
jgi:hypothetical protein